MKKTNSIYLYRIIFTIIIAVFHYPLLLNHLYALGAKPGWYIAADGFFIISGYLMHANLDKYKERFPTAWEYTKHRYKSIWGKYICAFVVTFIVVCLAKNIKGLAILDKLLDSFFEIILLQAIGLNRGWSYINPTLWYISVMIIAGYFIYYFLLKHQEAFLKIIAPVLMIIGISYLYRNLACADAVVDTFDIYGNTALIRGFIDMMLGVYGVYLTKWISSKFKNVVFLKIVSAFIVVFVFASALLYGRSVNDFALLALLTIAISVGFIPRDRVFVDVMIEKISGITLEIYLLHEVYRTYLMKWIFGEPQDLKDDWLYTLIYLVLVIASAVVLHMIWRGVAVIREKDKHEE